jgi:hypothetical protein
MIKIKVPVLLITEYQTIANYLRTVIPYCTCTLWTRKVEKVFFLIKIIN